MTRPAKHHGSPGFLASAAVSRRDCLKAAGLAAAGLPLLGRLASAAEDGADKAAARKYIKLGIMSDVYSGLPLAEAVKRIKADGFVSVVTSYAFADVRFDIGNPEWAAAKKIVDAFEGQGIAIAAAGGYYNVVSPDPAVRKRGEGRMEAFFANWKRLGCSVISTATGSFNPQSEWAISPKNATEEGYADCRKAIERLARLAEKAGAVVSVEPYWQNVIDSIDRTERLFRDVNSPALKLVMDPCNYFQKEDLPKMQPMLEEMFKRLGDRIVLAHAKDVKAAGSGTDLPAAGRGAMDYPLFLRLLGRLGRDMPLILEHLDLNDMVRSRDFVRGQFARV
jgi:sugar phosphate isomerase/epimerase